MTLSAGVRLGPYEIVSTLGAGGMGEVYRARDSKLKREVAIKVLPESLAEDPDALARFEREALAVAALSHPNILAIHNFGTHDGVAYAVMELLEGETLRERLGGGRLAARKALDYGIQVARGLAAAHEKGIVHRDLKPENLFLTRDGRVKILDFGLAKLRSPESGASEVTSAPTQAAPTEPGVVMGTVGYMAPEQVRGQPADHRSDIFAFGAILHEMLTGNRAFRGGSPVETMSAILREEPAEIYEANERSPGLGPVVRHCLEKSPEERFQSARDVAFDLENLLAISASTRVLPTPTSPRERRRWVWLASAGLALALLAAGTFLGKSWRSTREPPSTVRVSRLTDFEGLEEFPAVSPDGKSVAFTAHVGNTRQIWVRLVAGGTPLQLTHDPADHQSPRWAPDGGSLFYFSPSAEGESQGELWEIPALGGSPRRIGSSIGGAEVSHDGKRIAFFRARVGQVELAISAREGSNEQVVAKFPLGSYYLCPRWSPDDKWIAYQRGYVFAHDIFVIPAEGGTPRQITNENRLLNGLSWTPDGSGIVYSSSRQSTVLYLPVLNLWTVRRDGGGLRQLSFGEVSYTDPDLNTSGAMVATRTLRSFNIWKFPVDGVASENSRRGERITTQTGQVQTPSAAPDGRQIVFLSDSGGHGNLWVIDADSHTVGQITYEREASVALGVPVWSPDGRNIAFVSTRGLPANVGVWLVSPDGSNLRNIVPLGGWACWSSDGRWLYYNESSGGGGNLMKIPADGGSRVTVRTDNATRPAIAPDGSALYFVNERPTISGSSDYEVRVARPENGPSQMLARISAGRIPRWQLIHPVLSPDGKWLALPLSDGVATNIWALPTSGGPMRQLTDFGRPTFITRRVSWSPDGWFLFAALGEGDSDVVQFDGLLR